MIAFLYFSPEAGNTNGYFVHMMGCENTQHNVLKTLATQLVPCKAWAVCLRDCEADWELCFTVATQPCEKILFHILLGQDQYSNFEVKFLLNMCCFCTIIIWGPSSCSCQRRTSTLWKCFQKKSNIDLTFFFFEGMVKGDYLCVYITELPQKLLFVHLFLDLYTAQKFFQLFSLSLRNAPYTTYSRSGILSFPLFLIRLSRGSSN